MYTITRHNKSFMHNINPLKLLNQWNYHDTIYLRASCLAWEIVLHVFQAREKCVSGIALAQKAHCQKLKTLSKLRTDLSVMCCLIFFYSILFCVTDWSVSELTSCFCTCIYIKIGTLMGWVSTELRSSHNWHVSINNKVWSILSNIKMKSYIRMKHVFYVLLRLYGNGCMVLYFNSLKNHFVIS